MKNGITAVISSKLKKIYPDRTIYPDSAIQSTKDFRSALSVMESGTKNIGIDIQNVSFLTDITLINNKPNRNLTNELASRCGIFLNTVTTDEQILFPRIYLPDEVDDIRHTRFTLELLQRIE